MGKDGVAVRADVAAAVARFLDPEGSGMNVSATCRDLGISTKTFYKYAARFSHEGVEGFYPRSRRPATSPRELDLELEDVLLTVRKQQQDQGWDYGADAVLMLLEDNTDTLWPADVELPSRSTINRVFQRRGVLSPTPKRRPRRRYRRFARDRVNALWQYDGFDYRLATGKSVVVLHLSDDCSRVDLALNAVTSENSHDVWQTFCVAAERYGLPTQVLSDNGTGFSGKRRGWTSAFEQNLSDLGIKAITSSVNHPQTCGKNERAHQRVRKWLRRQPIAGDIEQLQTLLDAYRAQFNTRRNQVLEGLTPHQRYDLGPTAFPTHVEVTTHLTRAPVSDRGAVAVDNTLIGLGRAHAARTATVFRTGDHAVIFIDDTLVRELYIDRNRRYQPRHP